MTQADIYQCFKSQQLWTKKKIFSYPILTLDHSLGNFSRILGLHSGTNPCVRHNISFVHNLVLLWKCSSLYRRDGQICLHLNPAFGHYLETWYASFKFIEEVVIPESSPLGFFAL